MAVLDTGESLALNSPVDILDIPLVGVVALLEMFQLQNGEDRLYWAVGGGAGIRRLSDNSSQSRGYSDEPQDSR